MAETARADERIARPRNRDQFQFIDERRIRPDIVTWFTFMSEAKLRWKEDDPLRANSHSLQSLLPTLHSTVALGKKMLAAVELFAINEIAAVLDDDQIVGARLFASTLLNDSILE